MTANFVERYCTVGGQVQCGESVAIAATASRNYCFGGWSGLLGIISSDARGASSCQRTGDTSVPANSSGVATASFTPQPCSVPEGRDVGALFDQVVASVLPSP